VGTRNSMTTSKPHREPHLLSPKARAFHAHLDVCVQCESFPFELCAIGAPLLREAALESADALGIRVAAQRCFDAAAGVSQEPPK
jgi:hypothetical protein